MKKTIITLGLGMLLTCSILTLTVVADEPTLRLPTQLVTMRAEYAINTWFSMTLSSIPSGFDVINGVYRGWCVEIGVNMTLSVNHQVELYSSYDPEMPDPFLSDNWDIVNYVINNYEDENRQSVQEIIWKLVDNDPLPDNDTYAQELYNDSIINGQDFMPTFGQKIAILVDVINQVYEVQRTIFEFTLRPEVKLGDLVWNDYDADGIQDSNEPGIQGVTVELYNETNEKIETAVTDIHGYYSFSNVTSTNYSIQFKKPSGYAFTKQDRGTDDSKDSDANPTSGKTDVFTFAPNDLSWDCGLYVPSSGNPEEPTPPPTVENTPPTADGTAGEPYTVPFGSEIRFNGSRSYDRDGTIVSYLWSFGDGTTANGEIVTHNYTTPGKYTVMLTVTDNDGATDNYTTTARSRLPNRPPLDPTFTGPVEGKRNVNYQFTIVTTDPDEDDVQYMISWGDGSNSTPPLFGSSHNIQLTHQWTEWGFYQIQAYAQDPEKATSNTTTFVIAIDVKYAGNQGYLINTDSTGAYDTFYSNRTQNQTRAQRQQTGIYLIDTDGDNEFDYQFDPASETVREYPESISADYMMLLAGAGVAIIILLFVGYIIRRRKK